MGIEKRNPEFLEEFEYLIRAGRTVEARERFGKISWSHLSRHEISRYANIARRLGQASAAVRVLNPIVRSKNRLIEPTSNEKAEYALALVRVGAVPEGMKLLRSISLSTDHHEIQLYEGMARMCEWNSEDAIPFFESYLIKPVNDYERLIAQVNLASCQIFIGRYFAAQCTLSVLDREVAGTGYKLLEGNILELWGQLHYFLKNWTDARDYLGKASKLLSGLGVVDELWVKKWQAVIDYSQDPGTSCLKKLETVKSRATELNHWETVRDCDFHRAIVDGDRKLIEHLYHGTPFTGFRNRLMLFAPNMEVSKTYIWKVNRETPYEKIFDLQAGREDGSDIGLKANQLPLRLLRKLSSDFYRPRPLVSVFSELFPDDFYDPLSSSDRVHQIYRRLRQWFRRSQIPLDIEHSDGGTYRISASRPYALRTHLLADLSREELFLKKLINKVERKPFSAGEAQKFWSVSRNTVLKILDWGFKNAVLDSIGEGPKKKYKFSEKGMSRLAI